VYINAVAVAYMALLRVLHWHCVAVDGWFVPDVDSRLRMRTELPEVANVEVNTGRNELRVVGGAEDDADDITSQRPPVLLRDVVDAQTVLKRQIEEVSSLKHVEAELCGT